MSLLGTTTLIFLLTQYAACDRPTISHQITPGDEQNKPPADPQLITNTALTSRTKLELIGSNWTNFEKFLGSIDKEYSQMIRDKRSHYYMSDMLEPLDKLNKAMKAVTNTVILYNLVVKPLPPHVLDLIDAIKVKHEMYFLLRHWHKLLESQEKLRLGMKVLKNALLVAHINLKKSKDATLSNISEKVKIVLIPVRAITCGIRLVELATREIDYLHAYVTATSCLIAAKHAQHYLNIFR